MSLTPSCINPQQTFFSYWSEMIADVAMGVKKLLYMLHANI